MLELTIRRRTIIGNRSSNDDREMILKLEGEFDLRRSSSDIEGEMDRDAERLTDFLLSELPAGVLTRLTASLLKHQAYSLVTASARP